MADCNAGQDRALGVYRRKI